MNALDPLKEKRRRTAVNQPSDVKPALALLGDNDTASGCKTRATAEGGSKKGHFYKPLPKQFCRDGFTFRQIAREGNAAIYEQTWNGCPNPSVCYEVIRIRRREGFQIGARFIEPGEVYPNSEAWGVDGFTRTDKDAAFAKLRDLATSGRSEQ
jgi:hypothetical protein